MNTKDFLELILKNENLSQEEKKQAGGLWLKILERGKNEFLWLSSNPGKVDMMKENILESIHENPTGYATTEEIAERIGVNLDTAETLITSMARESMITPHKVYHTDGPATVLWGLTWWLPFERLYTKLYHMTEVTVTFNEESSPAYWTLYHALKRNDTGTIFLDVAGRTYTFDTSSDADFNMFVRVLGMEVQTRQGGEKILGIIPWEG